MVVVYRTIYSDTLQQAVSINTITVSEHTMQTQRYILKKKTRWQKFKMAATHMGASNTKGYFEKWIKYLKLKKTKMAEIQDGSYTYGASKHMGGVQT